MNNDTRYVDEGSSSTSLSSQQDVDDRMIAVVLSEEYAELDGAVGRRLSNLAPVAHIPRINTFIPNINDASLDHQRLLQRYVFFLLFAHGYCKASLYVSGDGNCQFRALSDQIYKSPEYHKHVRKDVVKQVVTITIVNSQILFNGCILREITLVLFPYLLISKQPKEEEDTRRAGKRKANLDQEGWFLACQHPFEYSAEESLLSSLPNTMKIALVSSQIAIRFCGLISPANPSFRDLLWSGNAS
ncbi:hypothetical protein C3L33_22066, partial [Rhododendron williamsianum]